MSDAFWVGCSVGSAAMLLILAVGVWTREHILVRIGRQSGVEKLVDGNFYYIIPESRFLELKQAESTLTLAKAFSEAATASRTNYPPAPHA